MLIGSQCFSEQSQGEHDILRAVRIRLPSPCKNHGTHSSKDLLTGIELRLVGCRRRSWRPLSALAAAMINITLAQTITPLKLLHESELK